MRNILVNIVLLIAAVVVSAAPGTNDTVVKTPNPKDCFKLKSGTVVCPPIKRRVEAGCVELLSGSVVC